MEVATMVQENYSFGEDYIEFSEAGMYVKGFIRKV
jgi:hypothetical protein